MSGSPQLSVLHVLHPYNAHLKQGLAIYTMQTLVYKPASGHIYVSVCCVGVVRCFVILSNRKRAPSHCYNLLHSESAFGSNAHLAWISQRPSTRCQAVLLADTSIIVTAVPARPSLHCTTKLRKCSCRQYIGSVGGSKHNLGQDCHFSEGQHRPQASASGCWHGCRADHRRSA